MLRNRRLKRIKPNTLYPLRGGYEEDNRKVVFFFCAHSGSENPGVASLPGRSGGCKLNEHTIALAVAQSSP